MRSGSFLLSARSTSDLLSVLDSLLLVGKYGASLGDTTDVSVVPQNLIVVSLIIGVLELAADLGHTSETEGVRFRITIEQA